MELPECPGYPPGVGFLVLVVEGFDLLLLLLLAQLGGVGESEELGGELDQPLGVDGRHLAHVLLGRQHQLVVHHPETQREGGSVQGSVQH